ncbi:hypothetical protein D3C85_1757900 [compost metagenome]
MELATEARDAQPSFVGHIRQGGPVLVTTIAQLFENLGAEPLAIAEADYQPLR